MLAKSTIAEELAPLCDSSATGPPCRGRPGMAVTGMPSVRFANPRRFGPSSTMPSDSPSAPPPPPPPRLAVPGRQHDRVADARRGGVAQRVQGAGLRHHHERDVDLL